MSERFKVLFQDGFFKILDDKDRVIFQNYCRRMKGKMGTIEVEDGFQMEFGSYALCPHCGKIFNEGSKNR
jgi:hypothetical protein